MLEGKTTQMLHRARAGLGEFLRRSEGQDLVEYAVLTSLVSLVAVVTVGTLGTTIGVVFQTVADQLEQ